MANKSAQYDVRLAFSADVAQARQQLKQLQTDLTNLTQLKSFDLGTRITKEMDQALIKAGDLKVMLEKATDINTGKLNLTSFSNQLTKNGESLATYRKALSALGTEGEEAFLSLTQSIITADAALTTGSKKLNDFKKTMANTVKWQISSSMMHSFIGGIETAYNYAKDLDRSLTDIKIVTEGSSDAMAGFAEKANKAAQALSTTTNNYAKASLIYYQQGLTGKEVEDRTAVTIKMANAAGESASKVSDQLTAVWNNFYDGSKSLEYYADVMVKLGAYTASSTDEISAGVQKFASVAKTIGLSYEYATSALATLTAKTRETPETIGNSLKTLFARIQGLSLGETLDDGTDLNKYSKALATAGINVKDQNDELKDMNVILDEMMDKWDGLSRAQQVALAQTVGGVRQYTQLVNLMENKEYFKELVGVAENSTGTLNTQAEIYADSWEAARMRVQSAAEGIYQSLIDEEFFKDVDNITAGVLNGIDAIIDGLGGVKGVLAQVGGLALNLYRKELSQGIDNVGTMFMNMTAKGRATVEARRQEALNEQKELFAKGLDMETMGTYQPASYEVLARYEKYSVAADYQQQILDLSKQLTEEEQKQASIYVDELNAMQQKKVLAGEQLDQAENLLSTTKTNLIMAMQSPTNRPGDYTTDQVMADVRNMSRNVETFRFASELDYYTSTRKGVRDSEIGLFNTGGAEVQKSYIEELKQIQGGLTQLGDKDLEFFDSEKNKEALNALNEGIKEMIKNLDNGSASAENLNKLLRELKDFTGKVVNGNDRTEPDENGQPGTTTHETGAKEQVHKVLSSVNQRYENVSGTVGEVAGAMDGLNASFENSERQVKNTYTQYEILIEQLKKMANQSVSTGQAIVAVGTGLANVGAMANSIKGMINIWDNDNLSGWEKAVGFITSLGILLPTYLSLAKAVNTISLKITATKTAEATAHAANAAAIEAENVAQKGAVAGAKGLVGAFGGVSAAAMGIAGAITIAIGLISLAVSAFNKQKEATKEAATASKELTEQLQDEYNANQELITSYEKALEVYNSTQSSKAELISVGEQLIDVYDIENGSLLLLTGQYEKLAEAAREAAKAEAERIAVQAGIAYQNQADVNKDEVSGLSGGVYSTDTTSKGAKMRQAYYLATGDEWWRQDFGSKEEALKPENLVQAYEGFEEGASRFAKWVEENLGDEYTQQDIEDANKGTRQWLADNKELYSTNDSVNTSYENSLLESAFYSQDFTNINSASDFAKIQDKYVNELKKSMPDRDDILELANNYLYQKGGDLAQWAQLDESVRQFSESSGINKNVLEQLSTNDLKIALQLNPYIASDDIDVLKKQIEEYSKTHPVNISASLKNAKKALKDEMSDKDWEDFWADTSDISWGSNGIVSQETFKKMMPEQQQAYLNTLSQQNYTAWTPEAINQRYQDSQEINQRDKQTLLDKQNEELNNLQAPTDVQLEQHEQWQSLQNKIDSIKNIDPETYNTIESQLSYVKNGTLTMAQVASNLKGFYTEGKIDNRVKDILAYDDLDTLENYNKDQLNGYDFVEDYWQQQLDIAQEYGPQIEELDNEIKEAQLKNAKEIQSYWQNSSNTIAQLSKTDFAIGDIIQPEQYNILKEVGVEMDKYFIQTEGGTYKLVAAAEEFNRAVGATSIEHAYDDVDSLLNNFYGSEAESDEEAKARREAQIRRANMYLTMSEEELKASGNNVKERYIEAMGANPDDFASLEEGVLQVAQDFIDAINRGEYRIDLTVANSSSMSEFEENAQKAGWQVGDQKYTNALLDYQQQKGNGLGRDEALALHQAQLEKNDAETNLSDINAQLQTAQNNRDNAKTTGDIKNAQAEVIKLTQEQKKAEEDLAKATEKVNSKTDDLSKRMKKVDFTTAIKDLKSYRKEMNAAKEGSDEYEEAVGKIAISMEKAFGKTVTNEFVKNNKKLIDQMVDPSASLEKRQAATNTLNFKLQVDEAASKQSFTDALQKIDAEIDPQQFLTNLNNINLDAEGHIVMTGDNSSAIAALGGVLNMLATMDAPASEIGSLLNSILGTNIELDAEGLEVLQELAAAMVSGDPEKLASLSEEAQNLSMKIFGTGEAPAQPRRMDVGNSGGGGGGSKKSAADIGKEIQDKRIAVNEKKRERLETIRDGANPEDAQKYIKEEIDLLEEEQQLLEEQIKSWKTLLKTKVQEFNAKHPELEITLDDNGEIANASELWGKVWAEYEKNMESGMSKEDLNEWFTKISDDINGPMGIQENIDENVAAIAQKEKEQAELELESITQAIDWKVKQIDFQIKRLNYYQDKLLKQAHGNKQTIEAMLEGFAYQEQEMLQLFDKGATLRSGIDQLNSAKAKYPDYAQKFDEQILEYRSDLIDVNDAILDLRNDIEDLVQNVMELALDEIDKQIERLDTYTSMMDHLTNIIDLSGRSMLDMGLKTQIGATKVQTMIGKMQTLKGQMDGLTKAQKEAQAALDERRADGDESSVKFWENQVEVIKQEVEKASDEFLGSWEETLEAAQELFEMRVEMAVNTLSNALSPFETLEQFQDRYEKAKNINEQYLDDAERLYELNKLNRQLNLQLKDTDDILAKEKLKEIQQEINDLQADGVQMSQYDLEYLQKKYDLQLAEIALMEQQNSKTSMRLIRDAAGNWTYAYDADEQDIEDATQKYEDAVYELGELSKDYINDVSEQLIQNQIDFKEALQDLDKNSADYSDQLLALQEYYVERQRYLLDELNKGVVNSGQTFHDTLYGQMTDLYDYNDAYMQFVNNSNTTISELQTNYKDWQKVVETAMNVAGTSWDSFGTDMGGTLDSLEEHIQKLCDEIEELVDVLMGYISQSIGMVQEWEQKYSKRTDQELAKNEAYIDGNYGGGGGIVSDFDMRTDWNRVAMELANGGINSVAKDAYGNEWTYDQLGQVMANRSEKYDRMAAGEDTYYEGSGAKMDKDTQAKIVEDRTKEKVKDEVIKAIESAETGAYTGDWGFGQGMGPDNGKIIKVHPKELILNKTDTRNILSAVDLVRRMNGFIDNQVKSIISDGSNRLSDIAKSYVPNDFKTQPLQQEVKIEASFPGVSDHFEIEQALYNLTNDAAQYMSANKNK